MTCLPQPRRRRSASPAIPPHACWPGSDHRSALAQPRSAAAGHAAPAVANGRAACGFPGCTRGAIVLIGRPTISNDNTTACRCNEWRECMFRTALLVVLVSTAVPLGVLAQTPADLKNDANTPDDVLVYGMGYSGQRYSPLTQ